MRKLAVALGLIVILGATLGVNECGGGNRYCPARPSSGLYATFVVNGSQYFQAWITNPTGIGQALDLWRGTSRARIPIGDLVCTAASWNCGWNWHMDPATVTFAEVTIEVCDGTPRYIESHCASFGDQYCPWAASLVELRDCRTGSSCPIVPR